VEASTTLFAEIQGAYEVLSDVQERAWYDSHRDVILQGGDTSQGGQYSHNVRMTTTDDILKLFLKFNPQMDFSDSPSSFFGGLRETFDQLAREENLTCQLENLGPVDYPSFGHSGDDYNEVVRPFYATWNGFATKKTFAWKDIHRYSEAPDRRIRRLMEKENKRLRDEGVREFNDAVRSLVAFVRKRDPRCKANAQSEAERQKLLRDIAATQAARSRAANEAKLQPHTVPEWARAEAHEELSSQSEAESEKIHFECVVCRKIFKSEKQFEAHERSKKHLKAVKQLRWEMRAQNKELDLDEATPGSIPSNDIQVEETPQSKATVSESRLENCQHAHVGGDVEPADEEIHSGNDPDSHTSLEYGCVVGKVEQSTDGYESRELAGADAVLGEDDRVNPIYKTESVDGIAEKLSSSCIDDDNIPAIGVGKAKQKRAKKAAQNASKEFKCLTCGEIFSSNTRLFNHIKELNHAQPVLKPSRASAKKKR
jgi:DnaJ family protein A protein 5